MFERTFHLARAVSSALLLTSVTLNSSFADDTLPILQSDHAQSYMTRFCANQPDDAVLPLDPREMVKPGINTGKAVAFNAYWEGCVEQSGNPYQRAQTCGEYRERKLRGEILMRSDLNLGGFPVAMFNRLWKKWGLDERPANFDAQVRERYGLAQANFNNPYPLPGENPNETNGGSGQLPAGMTLSKRADGSYSNLIAMTCDFCHSSQIDALGNTADARFVSGIGNHNLDGQLLMTDMLFPYLPMALSSSRGVTNAMGLSGLVVTLLDFDSLAFYPATAIMKTLMMQMNGNTSGAGDTKMPAWWNASHRPRKFWDAGYSYDAMRMDNVILQITTPILTPFERGGAAMRNQEIHAPDTQVYIESLGSPVYPGAIDNALATQGAVLFHAKDLWANGGNADVPKPPTNGSCAGCHGVYSPYYANDKNFLENPNLKGIAAYISPIEQIQTDPARLQGFTKPLFEILSTSWLSYPEAAEGYVAPENKDRATEKKDDYLAINAMGTRPRGACSWNGSNPEDTVGYLTPPLHGIWATAPYLHNGSIPDVWSLLKPSERPALWRRQLTDGEGTEHGFATDLAAYDQERMGWKFDEICDGCPGSGYVSSTAKKRFNRIINRTGNMATLGYQSYPPVGRKGVEDRKVFDTTMFGKGNEGHVFGQVLTDLERRAIIEYLKTL